MSARRRLRTGWLLLRRAALVAALTALVLGLGNVGASSGPREPQLDVVVAVDLTTSMSALDDPSGSRITAVRRDLAELTERLRDSRIAIIGFGRENRVLLPLSPDRESTAEVVEALQVEQPTAGIGTSIGDVVPALRRQLARAATDADDDRLPVIVLVTDGENTRPGRQRSFARVGRRAGAAVVLGYGTAAGGVMPVRRVGVDEDPPPPGRAGPLITDARTGKAARSRRDAANLERIAGQLDGSYVEADGTQDMAAIARALEDAARPDVDPDRPARELRWLWALLVLLLVLPELRLGWRQYLEARREVRP